MRASIRHGSSSQPRALGIILLRQPLCLPCSIQHLRLRLHPCRRIQVTAPQAGLGDFLCGPRTIRQLQVLPRIQTPRPVIQTCQEFKTHRISIQPMTRGTQTWVRVMVPIRRSRQSYKHRRVKSRNHPANPAMVRVRADNIRDDLRADPVLIPTLRNPQTVTSCCSGVNNRARRTTC